MTTLENLMRNYRVAFLAFLPRRQEAARHRGYQLGRAAVAEGLSILDVSRVHHQVILEVLRDSPADELLDVAAAASEFFLEVLATFDMTQRDYREERQVGRPRSGPPAGAGRPEVPAEGRGHGPSAGTDRPGATTRPIR